MRRTAGEPSVSMCSIEVFDHKKSPKINAEHSRKMAGSRGQSRHPLLHVTELMLPPLGALKGSLSSGWAVILAILLTAQSPASRAGESSIAGALPGDQEFPALGITADGGYSVWEDNRIDGNGRGVGIAATRLDAGLTATGQVFRVNQLIDGNQEKPQVLLLGNGNTLFAWEVRHGAKTGVYLRVLGTNGNFTSGDVLVNTPTWKQSYTQTTNWLAFYRNRLVNRRYRVRVKVENVREEAGGIALAALADGGALVAYHAMRRTETNTWDIRTNVYYNGVRSITNAYIRPVRVGQDLMHDIFFQRLDSAGRKVGPEVLVNQYTAYNQRTPAVAVLADGRFVVAWVCEAPSTADWRKNFQIDLYGRIFSPAGEPVGDEFPIAVEGDSDTDLIQANPALSALPGGGFAAFWSQQESTTSRRWDVYGGTFGADGMPTGSAFRLNEYTQGDQFGPKVAASGDRQLVVWTSVGQDGSREGVFGRFLAAGALDGSEFRVNTTTISRQIHPAVASDGQGRFFSVWSSFAGETGFDLFGRILPGGGN